MYDKKKIDELKKSLSTWEETSLKKALSQLPERSEEFITTSSEPINRLYTPFDIAENDYAETLGLPGEYPFTGKKLINQGNKYSEYFAHLPKVSGITVNKAHGSKSSIEKCIEKYSAEVETMESAAIFSICLSQKINFQCLRSISNFVEPRNRAAWDIEKALKNLTTEINTFILAVDK